MTRRPNVEAREAILRAAFELIAECGYEAASMDRVAVRAGVKKANLFHYYPSKEKLGLAVVAEASRRYRSRIGGFFSDDDQDPIATVRLMFATPERADAAACGRGCFFGRMTQEIDDRYPALQRKVYGELQEWRAAATRYFEAWRKKGYFRGGFSAAEAADAVLSLYEGGILLSKAVGEWEPAEHAGRAAVRIVVTWKV
jgi:TetR/AcrR family transcriptional repressor of nem operon